ncbi:MAG: SO2930 family diheme c-type cytochrome [Myxococcota bacterium]
MRLLALLSLGCSVTPAPQTETPSVEPTDELPDERSVTFYGVTGFADGQVQYVDEAVSYRLATPLFSDYAIKQRAVIFPEGEAARYDGDGILDFPVGTVILKSFLFPADFRQPDQDVRVIETRVLVREDDGWETWPYLWNDEMSDAKRSPSGAVVDIDFIDAEGNPVSTAYLVPQRNQCVDCHEVLIGEDRANVPIGPRPRNLAVDGQWEQWVADGLVTDLPSEPVVPAVDAQAWPSTPPSEWDDAYLDAATRDYLDVNCAHCHNPNGTEGVSSQLFLNWDNEDQFRLGVCKKPGSAGRGTGGLIYDIVPGEPESSILWYRTQTEEVGEMMPDIGRSLRDDRAIELIEAWIARLPGDCEEPEESTTTPSTP